LTDSSFRLLEFSVPQLPLLIDRNGRIVQPALFFLIDRCINAGRVHSKQSWLTYGQALYDFFLYLESKNLAWDEVPVPGKPSVAVGYREAALQEAGNKANTVNQRLRVIVRFYQWAQKTGRIDCLPYDLQQVAVTRRNAGFFAHTRSPARSVSSPDIMLREVDEPIKVLSLSQISELSRMITDRTHRLILLLALETGLRRAELITFPEKYVIDTSGQKDIKSHVRVKLSPRDMSLKGSKPRIIFIPRTLMDRLWQYSRFHRPVLANRNPRGIESSLFLTQQGVPFSPSGLYSIFQRASQKTGFHVTPHMLRHSFATHWLHSVPKTRRRESLLWLRDVMGHSSFTTTERYLHFLEQIADDEFSQYQAEVTALFEVNAGVE
jgi:site-specific recombinase XerD